MPHTFRIIDVCFPRDGVTIVAADEGDTILRMPVAPDLAKKIRSLPVVDLTQLIGAGAIAEDGIVIGLSKTPDAPTQAAPEFDAPIATKRKVIVESYGVAVDVDGNGVLWVYPLNRFGAPDPVGTRVTTTDAGFLAAADAAIAEALVS